MSGMMCLMVIKTSVFKSLEIKCVEIVISPCFKHQKYALVSGPRATL
jgi:hypothetical protein